MSEINGPNYNVNQINFKGIQKQNTEVPVEIVDSVEVAPMKADFSDSKAEALGRSMLFKGVDGVNSYLKALVENPQIAENSDRIFEVAYRSALESGMENPYEEAASASTTAM